MGGLAATWLAAREPSLISGLILLAPGFGLKERILDLAAVDETDMEGGGKEGDGRREGKREGFVFPSNYCEDLQLGYEMVEDMRVGPHSDEEELAATLRTPLFIAHGADDDAVPQQASRSFFDRVKASPSKAYHLFQREDHRLSGALHTQEGGAPGIVAAACEFITAARCAGPH